MRETELQTPMVSVAMITYNHARFLKGAIEAILNQKCTFSFDLIIADDASTDSSPEIVKNLIANHPNGSQIKYIRHADNKGITDNLKGVLQQCKGKYIATCEGDDVWTNARKLQKQVEFLEEHPNYGLVCGSFDRINHHTGIKDNYVVEYNEPNSLHEDGFEIDLEKFWKKWCTQLLTLVFRRELMDPSFFNTYRYFFDVHLSYQLLQKSKGFYFTEILGLQNIYDGGVFTHKPAHEKNEFLYRLNKDLLQQEPKNKYIKARLFNTLASMYANPLPSYKKQTLLKEMFQTIQNFNNFKHFVKCLVRWR